jgi:hypothetical protein
LLFGVFVTISSRNSTRERIEGSFIRAFQLDQRCVEPSDDVISIPFYWIRNLGAKKDLRIRNLHFPSAGGEHAAVIKAPITFFVLKALEQALSHGEQA